MKFVRINLPYLLITLIITINLFSLCDSKHAKEGEICSKPIPGFTQIKCSRGFECRPREEHIRMGLTGVLSICQRIKAFGVKVFAKEGEICSMPIPGFQAKQCNPGYECKPKQEDVRRGLKGIPSICQRLNSQIKIEIKLARPGEVCSKPIPGYERRKCVLGFECRPREQHIRMGLTGVSSICQRKNALGFKNFAKPGEVCSRPIIGLKPRECQPGYECRRRDQDLRMGMTGVSSICQLKGTGLRDFAEAGEVCSRPTPDFKPIRCKAGFECRPRDQDVRMGKKGVSSICQLMREENKTKQNIARIGEICFRPIPNFQTKKCPIGFECRPRDEHVRMGLKGVSSVCQLKKATGLYSFARAGEVCAKPIPGFNIKKCQPGYECRRREQDIRRGITGVSSICQLRIIKLKNWK